MPCKKVLYFKSLQKASRYALIRWRTILKETLSKKSYFTVAVSGGKSPRYLYHYLAENIPFSLWQKTHIFFVDERIVASGHRESNYRMLGQNLLERIVIPDKNIHPIPVTGSNSQEAARLYEQEIRYFLKGHKKIPRFDLILLGIGKDGHIASLFPGSRGLRERTRLVVAVSPQKAKYWRISMSLALINQAKNIIFLAAGKSKSTILKRVLKEDARLPAALVRPRRGNLLFLWSPQLFPCIMKKQQ